MISDVFGFLPSQIEGLTGRQFNLYAEYAVEKLGKEGMLLDSTIKQIEVFKGQIDPSVIASGSKLSNEEFSKLKPREQAEYKFKQHFNWDEIEKAKLRILSDPNRKKKYPLNKAGKEMIPLVVIQGEIMRKA